MNVVNPNKNLLHGIRNWFLCTIANGDNLSIIYASNEKKWEKLTLVEWAWATEQVPFLFSTFIAIIWYLNGLERTKTFVNESS